MTSLFIYGDAGRQEFSEGVMLIDFNIDGQEVRYRRNWFLGEATLSVAGEVIPLQSVWDPATHFSLRLVRSWTAEIRNHLVVIEKRRPFFAAAFRPHAYRIFVDQNLVAEKSGY